MIHLKCQVLFSLKITISIFTSSATNNAYCLTGIKTVGGSEQKKLVVFNLLYTKILFFIPQTMKYENLSQKYTDNVYNITIFKIITVKGHVSQCSDIATDRARVSSEKC